MTGSPVFKFNPNSARKKIQRKLNFVRDVPKIQLMLHIDNLFKENEKQKQSGKEKDITESLKASSLSSFVFDNKKGVKRKLDFDADNDSDMVSYKFSSRNISLCGFQSKNSSIGELKSITLSPNKNRTRGSYSRSSVTSTCRRRLFADLEPCPKKQKLESPILCQKTKKNEVKLSLKKKFPGVPNSDSARSGLLLNLAFSKYNLSNTNKQENVSFNFVDDSAVKTTKKEFVQYSSIKEDSSFRHSPVFTAIKKVKRRLNLDDNDTSAIDNINLMQNDINMEMYKGNITIENRELGNNVKENDKHEVTKMKIQFTNSEDHDNISRQSVDAATVKRLQQNEYKERNFESKGNVFSPTSLKLAKNSNKCRNDLFKNSKLRSLLRNEIFNLSKPNKIDTSGLVSMSNIEYSPVIQKSDYILGNRPENIKLKSIFQDLKYKHEKFHRIIIRKDNMENEKSSADVNHTHSNKNKYSKFVVNKKKKWIKDSFNKCKLDKCPSLGRSLSDHKREKFLNSHIQRFLNDCMDAAEERANHEDFLDDICSNRTEKAKKKPNSQNLTNITNLMIENCESQENNIPNNSNFVIENESQDIDEAKETEKRFITDVKSSENLTDKCENAKSRRCNNIGQIDPDFLIEYIESQNNENCDRNEFVIENATSQEINKQCVEEVELVIENVNSQYEVCDSTINDYCDTLNEISTSHDSNQNEILCDCVSETRTADPEMKVEEVLSPESVSIDYQYLNALNLNSTPVKSDTNSKSEMITFDSGKKRRRKKYSPDSLVSRLEKLVTRENSTIHMWEYEMSKKSQIKKDPGMEIATFCVKKMWKEFSRLIILCSFVNQDLPNEVYEMDKIKDFGTDISNSVIIIMQPSHCPQSLTYSSIFQIHPPWEIVHFEKCDHIIILRPCKIEIISKDGKPPLYKDPTLPNDPVIVEQQQFCACEEICDCSLPEGYQTVIQLLMLSNSNLFNLKSYSRLKNYNVEDFKSIRCIDDVVLKHKLYSSEYLYLDLRVLHIHKANICDDFSFWHIICSDKENEVCCIVINGNMKTKFSNVKKELVFRFFGILPWKLIPVKSVPLFVEHVEFSDQSCTYEKLGTDNLYVFVMSDKHGHIKSLN